MIDWPSSAGEMAARFRAHDWQSTPLGPQDGWAPALRTAVEMMLATPIVASLVVGPQRLFLYNDAAAPHYGRRHPDALGKPLAEAFPHEVRHVAPFYDRAFAGEGVHVPAQPLDPDQAGTGEVFEAALTPVRDEGGEVVAVLMTGFARGREARAEALLRESEVRHRLLTESWAQAVWETDGAGVVVADSPSWRAYTGQTLDEWLGYGWLDAVHPDDQAYAERQWRDATAAGSLVNAEFRLRAPGDGWRWTNVRAAPVLNASGRIEKWAGVNTDIDDRKRADAALRESEERQAFLLKLSDALRTIEEPVAIQREASRILRMHLGADRVAYTELEPDETTARIMAEDRGEGVARLPLDTYSWVDFDPAGHAQAKQGRSVRRTDVQLDPDLTPEQKAAFAAAGFRALINTPLLKSGRLIAFIAVHWLQPHESTPADVALVEETAERTWAAVQRALAEAALRDSEQRLQTLVEGVPQLVWRAVDGGHWTWASPQWTEFTGQAEEDSHERGWLDTVHPDDRERVKEVWAGALQRGEFHADYRIRHATDGRYRWFQTRAAPVRDEGGEVVEWLGTSTDVEDQRALQERQRVLLHELQHRVRNTLAVVRSLARSTGATSETVEDFEAHFEGRLSALARTQMVLTRSPGEGVALDAMVREELLAQAAQDERIAVAGPEVFISAKAAEVLALAIHELATNSVKYGALGSPPSGEVAVNWTTAERLGLTWLKLRWEESGVRVAAAAPRREGFGTELIEQRVPYELQGRGTLQFRPGGVVGELEFPLRPGESILQTDAPRGGGTGEETP